MELFKLTLNQMLLMFLLIVAGFVISKRKLVSENAYVVLSKLETYLFVPALSLFTQMTKCSVDAFKENWVLIIYGCIIVLVAIFLAYPLSRLFVPTAETREEEYTRNVYKYAMAFSNYGFMGNFIILGVFGADVFYKYSLFTLGVGVMCSGWGLFVLIPKDKSAGIWQNLKKGLLTPPLIALILGIVLGLLNVKSFMPQFIFNSLENLGDCQGPVAMVLAGLVIGGYDLKELLLNKKVYVATLLRLIVIPAMFVTVLKLIGTPDEINILALIAFATPLGLNTIVYPAAYGGETKTGASMTVISHTLSVITIPLMYLLFIEIL